MKQKEELKKLLENYDSLPLSLQQNLRGLIVFKRLLKGLTRKSEYEMLWNKCQDCKRRLPDYLLTHNNIACADYHTSGQPCCYKSVCKLGCFTDCTECKTRNYFSTERYDGYAESIKCWKCEKFFKIEVQFWGNLRENCRRYCNCGIDEMDEFSIQGYKTQKRRF